MKHYSCTDTMTGITLEKIYTESDVIKIANISLKNCGSDLIVTTIDEAIEVGNFFFKVLIKEVKPTTDDKHFLNNAKDIDSIIIPTIVNDTGIYGSSI